MLNFGARQDQIVILVSSPQDGSAHDAVRRLSESVASATPLALDDGGGADHPCWVFDYVAAGRTFAVPRTKSVFPVQVTVGGCEGKPEPGGYGMFGDAVLYVTSEATPASHFTALQAALAAPHDTGLAEVDTQALAKGQVKTTPMAPYVHAHLPPFAVFSTDPAAKRGFAGADVVIAGPGAKLTDALDAAVDHALDVRKTTPSR